MALPSKTDFIGLATTGLEVAGNAANASNQNLDITASNGAFRKHHGFGSIKAPHVDYKITGNVSNIAWKLGKVHSGTGNTGPFALKSVQIHTGAGDEPTVGADSVQIQAGATGTICLFTPDWVDLTPARHALTFGAFTFTESDTLSLQTADFLADCEIDPATINGTPKASDAVRAYEQVSITMWTDSDTVTPTIALEDGWFYYNEWDCSGSDGAMIVWTATLRKYLEVDS